MIRYRFHSVSKFLFYFRRYKSTRNILRLKERGMYQDLFPNNSAGEIIDLLNSAPQCVYAGFDPTADSLHVGNLLILMNLLHWQRGGHNAIAVVGGATARIGDPSGRTKERDELSPVNVNDNIKGITSDIEKILTNHDKYFFKDNKQENISKIRILNNESWYNKLSAVQLIGGAGRHLRMGTLLSRSSVETRLAASTGMSFTEFSYQLFQAYDWLHLFKNYNCRFQIGGNDQMGNIMTGHELISKVYNKTVYGLTIPLITTEMGDKFGKSAGNAVWLSSEKTSPFTFYQFWIRMSDVDAEKMLGLFTFESVNSIKDLISRHKNKPEERLAQKKLAQDVTLLVHGEEGLEKALTATKALYEGSTSAIGTLRAEDIKSLFQGAEIIELLLEPGQNVLNLAMKARCFPTISDAIRIITAGGFYINQKKASNPEEIINPSVHKLANNVSLLRVGKKNYYIIKWIS